MHSSNFIKMEWFYNELIRLAAKANVFLNYWFSEQKKILCWKTFEIESRKFADVNF